jgi:hypothetical protein
MTGIWGAQSFTPEQFNWLAANLDAVPAGHSKLLFYHYDFGGTNSNGTPGANFSQINPAALGIDGAIWGHNHGVAEGNLAARPFNLGLQCVIDGRRTFRIFRVHNGAVSPGPMHHSGGTFGNPVDSLTVAWNGPNNGSRSGLSATVTNLFGETWDHARLVFALADHDSIYAAIGGTIAQVLRQDGIASVYLDCVLPALGVTTVTVNPVAPASVGGQPIPSSLAFAPPNPNPFQPERGPLNVRFALPNSGPVRVRIFDLGGRLVATPYVGSPPAGDHTILWNGRANDGGLAESGVYVVRLETPAGARERKITVLR